MASTALPRPPYVLLFEGGDPAALPLTIMVEDRGALPLFSSVSEAREFVSATDVFGPGWEAVEISTRRLIRTLEAYEERVPYVAVNPPPVTAGGMRVRMGGVTELIEALKESRREQDLFGLGNGSG